MSYKIVSKFIKDISFEIPTVETFLMLEKEISKYSLNFDIKSKKFKKNVSFKDYFALKSQIKGPINNWDLEIDKNLNSLDFDKFSHAFRLKTKLSKEIKFLDSHKTLMAIDESTTIKTPTAKRTKNIISLGKQAKYKRIMTGSPVTKNPLDLYTQCEFLDPYLLDFASYYAFRNRYAEMTTMNVRGRSIQVVKEFRHLGELSESLQPFSYRVLKEDCLDLPPKNFIKRHIILTGDQRKIYDQMKKHALAMLNGKVTSTMTVLTQLMRLHQITCGHFTADDGSTQLIPNNRITELMNVLEEIEGKAIIWANYQRDITNIIASIVKEYGPGSVVDYYGLTPQEERQDNIRKFQNNPECRFIVGTPQTGGYGITLTQANTVIYYSNGYDLEKRLQSEDRAHRIGQKKTVTYVDLICEDTVDEKIVKALRDKINIASEVLGEELRDWI